MKCSKTNKDVANDDCEDCISKRLCTGVCAKREFVWGNSGKEPMWAKTAEEAARDKTCLSYFYDLGSDYNNQWRAAPRTKFKRNRSLPGKVRWAVFSRDGFACLKCFSSDDLTVDHIVPSSLGGKDDYSNLQTLCRSCNSKKGQKNELPASR